MLPKSSIHGKVGGFQAQEELVLAVVGQLCPGHTDLEREEVPRHGITLIDVDRIGTPQEQMSSFPGMAGVLSGPTVLVSCLPSKTQVS